MRRPRVEILYFEGCPNHEPARALVEQVATQLGVQPQVDLVVVSEAEAAAELRFLGSPTVRVDGRDVEPGADERHEFVLSCRVYRSERGFSGQPEEAWIREALQEAVSASRARLSNGRESLAPGVAASLSAAAISPSKLGPARHAGLTDAERELYFWILRRFASSGRPSSAETREAAQRLGLDAERALATFARDDLVHFDRSGEIAVAYPFSGRPTAHRVRFQGAHEVYAMCAIDALGIAPMFGEPIEIASRDPLTEEAIQVELEADGSGSWQPSEAVVVCGASRSESGESCSSCCPVLNFFASRESGERWLEARPEVRGQVISLPEAITAGRAVFGDVFEQR